MIWKSPAALGLLLLVACHGGAMASDVDPFLPRCTPSHETRIPIPTWDDNYGKLASLRHLISTWPSGATLVVYASFGALKDEVRIEKQDKEYSVEIAVEGKESEAGKIKVAASEPPQFALGYYNYWGFFEVSPLASPESEIALRRLDTFDVASSGRYCLGNGAPQAPLHETPAPQTAQSGSLPLCRRGHESRIPIATWKPKLTRNDVGMFEVHAAPPSGNGRIVYISIEDPKKSCDIYVDLFHPPWPGETPISHDLYSVLLPEGPSRDFGGVSINLRGNRTPVGTGCRFEGFYMNEPVAGIHQGWTETYFGAVERERIVASNHYCMAR